METMEMVKAAFFFALQSGNFHGQAPRCCTGVVVLLDASSDSVVLITLW